MTAPMNWTQLLSTKRFKAHNGEWVATVTPSSQEGTDALRTDFHIDYDRVVFSGTFRRLGRKTQVHPFAEHDHTHNRLTHSVEVASVGRSLGNRVGVMMTKGDCRREHALRHHRGGSGSLFDGDRRLPMGL